MVRWCGRELNFDPVFNLFDLVLLVWISACTGHCLFVIDVSAVSVRLGALAHLRPHEVIPRYERAHWRRNSLLGYRLSTVTTRQSCNPYDNGPNAGPVPFKLAAQWLEAALLNYECASFRLGRVLSLPPSLLHWGHIPIWTMNVNAHTHTDQRRWNHRGRSSLWHNLREFGATAGCPDECLLFQRCTTFCVPSGFSAEDHPHACLKEWGDLKLCLHAEAEPGKLGGAAIGIFFNMDVWFSVGTHLNILSCDTRQTPTESRRTWSRSLTPSTASWMRWRKTWWHASNRREPVAPMSSRYLPLRL